MTTETNNMQQTLKQTVFNALKDTKSATFVHLQYRNKQNELSNYLLNLNVSFTNMYNDDRKTLEAIETTNEVEKIAKDELLARIDKAIETNFQHEKNPRKNMFNIHKSILIHDETDVMYLSAIVVNKKVIEAGTYKTVNSSEKTLTKKRLEKQLKMSKIRTFTINLDKIQKMSANKNRILIFANS